jgi:hypothetical protein
VPPATTPVPASPVPERTDAPTPVAPASRDATGTPPPGRATPAQGGDAATARPGPAAPSRDGAVGLDGGPVPAAPSASAPLNLQLPRPGLAAGQPGSRGILPVLPPPPTARNKLADDIQKSAKPDCRTAYSGLGLLAVVPLARDAVKDNGCQW